MHWEGIQDSFSPFVYSVRHYSGGDTVRSLSPDQTYIFSLCSWDYLQIHLQIHHDSNPTNNTVAENKGNTQDALKVWLQRRL